MNRGAMQHRLILSPVLGTLAICRLEAEAPIPDLAIRATFFSLTRTHDELSIVAPQECVPEGIQRGRGWRALGIEGPPSTFDTDYVLVKEAQWEEAVRVLSQQHIV